MKNEKKNGNKNEWDGEDKENDKELKSIKTKEIQMEKRRQSDKTRIKKENKK